VLKYQPQNVGTIVTAGHQALVSSMGTKNKYLPSKSSWLGDTHTKTQALQVHQPI
jgi:hypothetical protein